MRRQLDLFDNVLDMTMAQQQNLFMDTPVPDVIDCFGACPKCLKNDGYVNIGRSQFFYCREHQLTWWMGSLLSTWRDESEEQQRQNEEFLSTFTIVDPIMGGHGND